MLACEGGIAPHDQGTRPRRQALHRPIMQYLSLHLCMQDAHAYMHTMEDAAPFAKKLPRDARRAHVLLKRAHAVVACGQPRVAMLLLDAAADAAQRAPTPFVDDVFADQHDDGVHTGPLTTALRGALGRLPDTALRNTWAGHPMWSNRALQRQLRRLLRKVAACPAVKEDAVIAFVTHVVRKDWMHAASAWVLVLPLSAQRGHAACVGRALAALDRAARSAMGVFRTLEAMSAADWEAQRHAVQEAAQHAVWADDRDVLASLWTAPFTRRVLNGDDLAELASVAIEASSHHALNLLLHGHVRGAHEGLVCESTPDMLQKWFDMVVRAGDAATLEVLLRPRLSRQPPTRHATLPAPCVTSDADAALRCAVENGHAGIVRVLLDVQPHDVVTPDVPNPARDDHVLLFQACDANDVSTFCTLLQALPRPCPNGTCGLSRALRRCAVHAMRVTHLRMFVAMLSLPPAYTVLLLPLLHMPLHAMLHTSGSVNTHMLTICAAPEVAPWVSLRFPKECLTDVQIHTQAECAGMVGDGRAPPAGAFTRTWTSTLLTNTRHDVLWTRRAPMLAAHAGQTTAQDSDDDDAISQVSTP